MSRVALYCASQIRRWRLSLFEKVILADCIMLFLVALAGLWITSHNLETQHYFIDTGFIVVASLLGLLINILLLRASFRPLFNLLHTIREVSAGKTNARVVDTPSDSEIGELAQAFNGMLDRLETIRREQAMLILKAQEQERRRLALELHDESSQNLTALLIHAEILSQSLQGVPDTATLKEVREQIHRGLSSLNGLTQRTLEDIRVLAQQLRPSVLDDLGLCAAFRWLAEDGRQRLKLAVELHLEGVDETLWEQQQVALYETTLFRIAQESLTNVARHACAQHVSISLTQDQQKYYLRICDDGQGFDPAHRNSGLGIFGMRERATLLGGTISISSHPGRGTIVEAMLPVPVARSKELELE